MLKGLLRLSLYDPAIQNGIYRNNKCYPYAKLAA